MANGDAAAAAGLLVVPATADVRLGYDNLNVRGDELARHMTTGTHTAAQIASGVLLPARIPVLDIVTKTSGVLPYTRVSNGYLGTAVTSHGLGFATNIDAAVAWLNEFKVDKTVLDELVARVAELEARLAERGAH